MVNRTTTGQKILYYSLLVILAVVILFPIYYMIIDFAQDSARHLPHALALADQCDLVRTTLISLARWVS